MKQPFISRVSFGSGLKHGSQGWWADLHSLFLLSMVLMKGSICNAVLQRLHSFQTLIQALSTKDWKKYIQIIWCLLQIEVLLTLKCIAGHFDAHTSNVTRIGRSEYTQHLSQFQMKFIFPDIVSHEQNIPKHNYSS